MESASEHDIKRAREAIQTIETIQSMIDVSAARLEGLRTQCSTSQELTQQEIRTLEGKLVKHFSRQLVIKSRFDEEVRRELGEIPRLPQWLRVVGLTHLAIEDICARISTVEALQERSEHELRALLYRARDAEVRRLQRAMQRLKAYTEALSRGEGDAELQLYWDSWERHGRGSPRPHRHHHGGNGKSPPEPHKLSDHLPTPQPLIKSRSHESQLGVKPSTSDLSSDTSQSSAVGGSDSPPSSPVSHTASQHSHHNNIHANLGPRSPRTPPVNHCMAHVIAHRFTKTFNMITTCDHCGKQILFGSGLKCKECKFKCHRDCESKVPPSCGLPPEFVVAFKQKFQAAEYSGAAPLSPLPSRTILSTVSRRRHPATVPTSHTYHPVESSSTTSSCNSSAPPSPAPPAPPPHPPPGAAPPPPQQTLNKQTFHFPEAEERTPVATPNHVQSPAPAEKVDLVTSTSSGEETLKEKLRRVSVSGSGSTDSGGAGGGALRADSLDKDGRWPRQNSLSMKEWDIPYDELKLFEVIGAGRFGTVYRGSWHGAVAVKLLHVQTLGDDISPLDTFKHEVATFRKTRHENLVLFMGACMKPPRLAIVTSLCKGNTLYTHIHLRKDKFTANKSVIVAQQITQGMGYLHARGIIHKDLKTKNIFLENGKVVITDFGLFSVTKLCFGTNARGDSLGIPPGWLCYLAPELTRALTPHASLHLPFSKATDVYAFGTVWYELLCGEFPFKGQPAESIIWQVGKGAKESLGGVHANRDIKDILMTCWAYRPTDRPDFPSLLLTLQKLPRKRLARSPSHPVHLSRSADSVF